MKSSVFLCAIFTGFLFLFCSCGERTDPETQTLLKDYVMQGDDAFSYTVAGQVSGQSWTVYQLKMVSGTWLTEKEAEPNTWWHWLNIIVPDQVRQTGSMMIIGGGSAHDSVPLPPDFTLIRAAVNTGSVISIVSNIPFQPVDFAGDEKGGRYEDDLIAYGWKQFLESGASADQARWLARFPMTRAVVRAMDVVQEVTGDMEKQVGQFFVTGASKRGWTTWTTAVVDDRVMGIAPIVIDLLNLVPSFRHHWQCYGEWSPAVEDYVDQGIMEWIYSEEFRILLRTVEPYTFTDQLTMPKFVINAAGDEFFVTDSWKFYWDNLKGEKYLQYIPNAGHGLNDSYNLESLVSFYHAINTGSEIPEFNWSISQDTIYMQVDPESDHTLRKWEAVNDRERDFRVWAIGRTWQMEPLERKPDGRYAVRIATPERGYRAGLLEVIFNPGSGFPLTFTSGTLITPPDLPYEPFEPGKSRGRIIEEGEYH
jgi:PhoPQ-activated pathogenicity-related protein